MNPPESVSNEINMPDPHPGTNPTRSSPHGATGSPQWASCSDWCQRPTPSQAHCGGAGCHLTFGGVYAFDMHRRGGACIDPRAIGLVERDSIWHRPDTDRRPAHHARKASS